MMTQKQIKAIKRLRKALNNCAHENLEGGVYDGTLCVWPEDSIQVLETTNFFEQVKLNGEMMVTKMKLDGGAGV